MTLEHKLSPELEIQVLSADFFSVEELEERLELAATMVVATECIGHLCVGDACAGDLNY